MGSESHKLFFSYFFALLGCKIQYLNSYVVLGVGSREPFEIQHHQEKRGAAGLMLNKTGGGNLMTKKYL